MERENGSCLQLRPSIFFRVQSLKCVITWGCWRGVRPCQRTRLRRRAPPLPIRAGRSQWNATVPLCFFSCCLMISSCEEGTLNFFSSPFPPPNQFFFFCSPVLVVSSLKSEKELTGSVESVTHRKSPGGSDPEVWQAREAPAESGQPGLFIFSPQGG